MTCSFRRYEDGDVDKNLKAKHVKALDAGSDSDGSARKKRRDRSRSRSRSPKRGRKKLREGDKCQAHFRGKSSAKLFQSSALRVSCSPSSYAMSQVPGENCQDPLRRYCGREAGRGVEIKTRPRRRRVPRTASLSG